TCGTPLRLPAWSGIRPTSRSFSAPLTPQVRRGRWRAGRRRLAGCQSASAAPSSALTWLLSLREERADGLRARAGWGSVGICAWGGARVPAELVAQGGDDLHGRGVILAGDEPRVQGRADRRHRDRVVDRGLHGPPALAGVLGHAADVFQAR